MAKQKEIKKLIKQSLCLNEKIEQSSMQNINEVNDVTLITFLNDRRYPRGMRNNNPGNIRISNAGWLGKIDDSQRKDRSFEQFKKYWYGVRALVVLLNNYYFKHNLQTIEKIINRFAPPVENETTSYAKEVCRGTGFKARDQFIWNRQNVALLVREICRHENGRDALITEGLFAFVWLKLYDEKN